MSIAAAGRPGLFPPVGSLSVIGEAGGRPRPTGRTALSSFHPSQRHRAARVDAYTRLREIIENVLASALIYLPSHANDFKVPEVRKYLDPYVRGSNNYSAEGRVKLMKLMWDAIGTEFGSRHALYERNYFGNHENIRTEVVQVADMMGQSAKYKGFAEQCMAEYDLDGWTVPDLTNPDDISVVMRRHG